MSKIRLKQTDEAEISGYIVDVTSGDFNSINNTLSDLITSGDTLSGEYSNLVSIVNILSGQNTGISGRLNTIESEFDAFDTQVNNFSGEVYSLSGEIVTLSSNLDIFSGDLVAAEADISTLESDVLSLSGRINTISGNTATATGLISSLSGSIDTISGNLTSAEIDLLYISGTFTGFTGTHVNNYVYVCDFKNSGTSGGSFSAGSWVTRDINTELFDLDGICSINSNQITLSGGLYTCTISCPALRVGSHKSRLYSVSSGSVVLYGTSEYSDPAGYYSSSRSIIKGIFHIPTGGIFKIEHRCGVGYAGTDSFGAAAQVDTSDNIYTIAEFNRIRAN